MYRLSTKELKVYFYHTQDTERILREWQEGLYPGHLLYGATHLPKYGVEVIPHLYKPFYDNRLKLTLLTAWRILTCGKKYDALYATSFRGIEGLIFLRALGLYRKPIVIWHHQPIVEAKGWFRERVSRLFYRGIDRMFFFSQQLVDESLKTSKANKEKLQVVPWGPDLEFYDHVLKDSKQRSGFISTGKEQRDLPTLIEAFSKVEKAKLTMYINEKTGDVDYIIQFARKVEGADKKSLLDAAKRMKKAKIVGYRDRILYVINDIIDALTEDKVLLMFISKNLGLGFSRYAMESPAVNEDYTFREAAESLIADIGDDIKNPRLMMYMIIELTGSSIYSSILYDQPVTITELKPYLYKAINNIIDQFEEE